MLMAFTAHGICNTANHGPPANALVCRRALSGLAKSVEDVQDKPMLIKKPFPIADIRIPGKRKKTLDPVKVQEIAEDMLENGQLTPIRLRNGKSGYVLIEGFHRLEALRALGEDMVDGYLVHAQLH